MPAMANGRTPVTAFDRPPMRAEGEPRRTQTPPRPELRIALESDLLK